MAIQFARIEIVGRSSGGNACCKGAYNARTIVKDVNTNVIYNFQNKGDNVYHEIMLPEGVDQKYKSVAELMNEIERCEKRKDSQLVKDIVLALPDDKELSLQDRIEIVHRLIEKREWIKEGLGVQIDIHQPHDGEKNWHAHLLVTTRRFTKDGLSFGEKATDLNPEFKKFGKRAYIVPELQQIHEELKNITNDYFKELGLENRVDAIGIDPQEHIGPVRMRSVLNQAVERNEDRYIASIEHLNSGQRLLEKVTHHMSVFNVGDLKRAVKFIPDGEVRERLVEDALASKSLLELHDEQGKNTGYYTTVEIREEEEKLLRLSSYVASGKNVIAMGGLKATENTNRLIESVPGSFSSEQKLALSHLLMDESGVRIVRGRAGSGKSHVLGQVATIAKSCGVNVIGLAPTHKAREELAKKPDFDQNDTVKGMLFKLRHGRFELPKYSLLVVDEAGMVGNEDYHELMRVAATRKCNVILAGDERQLASVQRGGMYEVYASSYGSTTLLDIQRQKSDWGKSVAMAFSRGEVATGVGILQAQNRLLVASNANESMQNLLSHWSKSEEKIADRLIIAVKNKDVDALNHGARQYLKVEGVLSGEEIAVGGHHYMQGDRILIKQTNKELGLTNGDLAQLVAVSKDKFVLCLENEDKGSKDNKEISFNPSSYSGFRHGYATTVFKAQGASIRDVFVFHDGFAGVRNSYVALSRHVNELKLYINNQSTISTAHLVKQLSHDPEIGSSLSYLTKADLAKQELNNEYEKNKGFFGRMVEGAVDFTAKQLITLADKYLPKSEYYEYKPPQVVPERVEAVLDAIGADMMMGQEEASTVIHVQEKIAVGENVMSANNINNIQVKTEGSVYNPGHIANVDTVLSVNKSSQSTKQRFYANADYARNAAKNLQRKTVWDNESEQLRNVVRFKAEQIARDLLGEPNKKLSDGRTLRFGENGKIAVRISGERMGTWYDFSSSTGGDIFALVQEKQACDFKAAAEYLRRECGMQRLDAGGSLKLVHDHNNSDLTKKYIKERQAEERAAKAKQMFVTNLHARAKDIGDRSVAHRYLTQRRGITCEVGVDIKITGIKNQGQYLPAIVAFARNEQGVITGGQQILLDKRTGGKADVDIAKRSFGKIAGSFVEVGRGENASKGKVNVTIIAEGLETALSVKQALANGPNNKEIQVKVLCSLGISNIKNYQAVAGEKIIIAADNDGQHAVTSKTIDTAQEELQGKGAYVEIARPERVGDFNDVLQQNTNGEGEKEIQNVFKGAMTRMTATTLKEYFINTDKGDVLESADKLNIAYIEKYDLPQDSIVDAYRKSNMSGQLELEGVKKGLEMAASHYTNNIETLKEAKQWGYNGDEKAVTKSMIGMDAKQSSEYCIGIRDKHLTQYLGKHLGEFEKQKDGKYDIALVKPIMIAEQDFLKATYESLKAPIDEHAINIRDFLQAGKIASTKPQTLDNVFTLANDLVKEGSESEVKLTLSLSNTKNMNTMHSVLLARLELTRFYSKPRMLEQERLTTKHVASAFSIIEKEQDLIANMHGKIVYHSFDKDLMQKAELAYTQKENNDLGSLKKIALQSLEIGAKTEINLLKDLQNTTDLKATREKIGGDIESHHIKESIAIFNAQKREAKTLAEVVQTLSKEQLYLSELSKNLEYPKHIDKELTNIIDTAKENKEINAIDKLQTLSHRSLETGAKTEAGLLKDLQNTSDLRGACEKIGGNIESHFIKQNIDAFDIEKNKAKTPIEVINTLAKKQSFLSSIQEKLEYPAHIDKDISSTIEVANLDKQENRLDGLNKLVSFVTNEKLYDNAEIVKHLKEPNDITGVLKNLTTNYQSRYLLNIEQSLNNIEKQGSVAMDGKSFDCPIKFLQHSKQAGNQEYLPHKELQQIQEKLDIQQTQKVVKSMDFEK